MKSNYYFVFILFVGLTFGACNEDNKTSDGGIPTTKTGKQIYKKYCTVCHGIKGNMGVNGAFDLTQIYSSLDNRIDVITNGRNIMTPFNTTLTKEEIEKVAKFTMTFNKNLND